MLEIRAEKAKRRLADWCQLMDETYIVADHHRRLIEKLEEVERGEIRRLIVNMPPQHGKSTTTTKGFPGWYLGRHPGQRIIIAAHTADLAYDFSRAVRNSLIEHGRPVFGVGVAQDSSAVDRWGVAGHRGYLAAAGVGGPITGRGADLLVIDDPVKDAVAAESLTQRRRAIDWWRTVARTRVSPTGSVVVVLTRWHEEDLAGVLLKEAQAGGEHWEVLLLPMLDEEGRILWPERYPAEEVANIQQAVGSRAWSALYQQRPAPAEGNVFKREWFRFYRRHELPTLFSEVIASWDCTFKDTKSSDYVSGLVVGRVGARKYLLERTHKRMDFVATMAAMKAQKARRPEIGAFLIEDKANGPAIIAALKGDRDGIPGLIAVEPDGSKLARAFAVSPTVEAGDFLVPHPDEAPWVGEYLDELCSFPAAPNDDDVDATTQALRRFATGYGGTVVTEPRVVPRTGMRSMDL